MRTALALTIFGGGLLQASLVPALRIADVAPDIPLIVVVLLALRRGPEFGCVSGFAAGVLQDMATGGLLGVQALTKALVGFIIGAAGGRLRGTQPLVQVLGLVLLTFVEGLGRFTLMKLFRYPAPFGEVMTYAVLPQALYNGFVAAALVFAMVWTESFRNNAS